MIYQKTQPPAVFDLVMELISLDLQSSASSQSQGPRRSEQPILDLADEGDDDDKNVQQQNEDEEEIEVGGGGASAASAPSAPRSQATTSDNGDESSPSSGGSFVHVETDTIVTPEGDVAAQATETAVVDVPAGVVEAAEEATAEELDKEDPPEPVAA